MSSLIQVGPAVLTLCYVVQTGNTDMPHKRGTDSTVVTYPYMVAVERSGCDKHPYEFEFCYAIIYTKCRDWWL